MAAVYSTGTSAISATSATDLRTALDAVLITHSAWTFIEAVAITGGTARVYKCAGTANSWGSDFYVAMTVFTAAPTQLVFQVFESWAASPTSQATRSVRVSGATANTAAPNPNGGYVVDNTGYPLDTATGNVARTILTLDTTTAWVWMLHVSASRIELNVATASGGTPTLVIAGVYVPNPRAAASAAGVFPLFAATGSGVAAIPGNTATAAANYSRSYLAGGGMSAGYIAASSPNLAGALSTAGAVVDGVEGVIRGTGIVLIAPGGSGPSQLAMGFLRGSLPGAYVFLAGTTNYPRPLDLVILSDGTRLAGLGGGGANTLLLTNVDAN